MLICDLFAFLFPFSSFGTDDENDSGKKEKILNGTGRKNCRRSSLTSVLERNSLTMDFQSGPYTMGVKVPFLLILIYLTFLCEYSFIPER